MFSRLTRAHLSFLVAFSALAGYLFHPNGNIDLPALLLCAGVWLMSAGASALNQAQERDVDSRMVRTRNRPLVTGHWSLIIGSMIASALMFVGLTLLWLTGSSTVFLLGLFALVWYNGVYTLLKRITPFAVLPGALCGALPPLMGWVLAGGDPTAPPILMLIAIIVLWQVPHFWLLALTYPEDARRSGLPDLFARISPERLRHLSVVWIVALLAGVGIANFSGLVRADLSRIIVTVALLLLAGALTRYHRTETAPAASGRLFFRLNLFMTLWFAVVAVDRFIVEMSVTLSGLIG